MPVQDAIPLNPIVDSFVGEITGLDLARPLDAATKSLLIQAHDAYPVLAVRGQSLDTEAFMAFGAVFGDFEIDHHVPQYQDKAHPEVVYLTNRDEHDAPDIKAGIEGRRAKHKFSAGPATESFIPMTEEQDAMHPPVVHCVRKKYKGC